MITLNPVNRAGGSVSPNNVRERFIGVLDSFFASPFLELPRALSSPALFLSLSWVFSFQQVEYLFRDLAFEFSPRGWRYSNTFFRENRVQGRHFLISCEAGVPC